MRELFMIVPPLNPWDKPHAETIYFELGLMTIAKTAGEAWYKHTRGDMGKVQAWFDRGYRLRRVRCELVEEGEMK
jgi:hypothetical protein